MTEAAELSQPEKADWSFRADYLEQAAAYLDNKADEIRREADRYRGLAAQARMLHHIGQHG